METQTILIVEDEPSLSQVIKEYLEHEAFQTHIIDDGSEVIGWIKENKADLILLDLMLPNKGGLDIFRELRIFSNVPVIMLTAKVDEVDRLVGLNMGADDYICKPYSPREVVARVKNVLRRSAQSPDSEKAQLPLTIDQEKMRIMIDGKQLPVTRAEFQLFTCLYQRKGVVFARQRLMDLIYTDGRIVSDRTIDSHIKNLRKKILAINENYDWIKAIYGEGYCFEE